MRGEEGRITSRRSRLNGPVVVYTHDEPSCAGDTVGQALVIEIQRLDEENNELRAKISNLKGYPSSASASFARTCSPRSPMAIRGNAPTAITAVRHSRLAVAASTPLLGFCRSMKSTVLSSMSPRVLAVCSSPSLTSRVTSPRLYQPTLHSVYSSPPSLSRSLRLSIAGRSTGLTGTGKRFVFPLGVGVRSPRTMENLAYADDDAAPQLLRDTVSEAVLNTASGAVGLQAKDYDKFSTFAYTPSPAELGPASSRCGASSVSFYTYPEQRQASFLHPVISTLQLSSSPRPSHRLENVDPGLRMTGLKYTMSLSEASSPTFGTSAESKCSFRDSEASSVQAWWHER